jgi:hypothetical protein
MKRSTIANIFAIAAVTAIGLGVAPSAKADNKGCSAATLKGTFADQDNGVITAPPALAGPFAGVFTQTYDGNGNLTATGMVSLNGAIIPAAYKGTYTVNSDCSGTYTVQISPLGITGHGYFVIAASGDELHILVTDPGTVTTCIARRQYPVGDWRQ